MRLRGNPNCKSDFVVKYKGAEETVEWKREQLRGRNLKWKSHWEDRKKTTLVKKSFR